MKQKISKIIPSYAFIPLISVILMNSITYHGVQIFTRHMMHHSLAIWLDGFIPFWPSFILFYVLAYVQWIVGYLVLSRENKEVCYHYLSAELIAKFMCFILFLVYPTTIIRPEITGNSLGELLTRFIYSCDKPVNLFPSIHCLESWFCFRGSMKLTKVPKWYKWLHFILAIFVFLSTVFVKQHVVLDIIGGVLVVELGLFLAKYFHTGRIFEKIDKILQKYRVNVRER